MLLRRSKSGDLGKGGKKAQALRREQELQKQRDAIPKSPPRLPSLYNGAPAPQLHSFGGEERHAPAPAAPDAYSNPRPSDVSRPSMEPSYSVASIPVPAIPIDPYARTESMTNRGRYSYASSAVSTVNTPRRVRRRKDPTPFNILIVGARGSGKTSFLEFLKTSLALPPKMRSKSTIEHEEFDARHPPSGNFTPHFLESEIDGERVGLTLWDSEGLERNVVDLQLRELSAFIESKFEDTFNEEMKVVRSPGVQDTHIHAVFLVLDPARLDRNIALSKQHPGNSVNMKYQSTNRVVGGLDEDLDLQVLRTLQGKTAVIPIVSKADTITSKHMKALKQTVSSSLKQASLDPLEALGFGDDDMSSTRSDRIDEADEEVYGADTPEENGHEGALNNDASNGGEDPTKLVRSAQSQAKHSKRLSTSSIIRSQIQESKEDEVPFLPLSVISPDPYEPEIVGRQFPWGFADPNNEEHCDFLRLQNAVFSEWRSELREASRDQWYESWRVHRLNKRGLYHAAR